jgi:hypothetical protein
VDFAGGVIRVRKSVKIAEGGPRTRVVVEDLKTGWSRRTLEMPTAVASMLAALRKDQAAARLKVGPAYADHGLVFPRPDSTPCWPTTIRTNFKRICKRAGLGSDWHPHEQRRSFVSILSDAGVDIDQIADAARHINAAVIRSVYRHVLADKLATAARVMDATFRTTGGAYEGFGSRIGLSRTVRGALTSAGTAARSCPQRTGPAVMSRAPPGPAERARPRPAGTGWPAPSRPAGSR